MAVAPPPPPLRSQLLHFWVKTDLVVDGRMKTTTALPTVAAALGRDIPIAPIADGTVTHFLVSAWAGGDPDGPGPGHDFGLARSGPDGVAEVRLRLVEGEPDAVKFSVSFNEAVPKGQRNCHFASSFVTVPDFVALLQAGGGPGARPGFPPTLPCFTMRDNFTKNTAILRFRNIATDCAAVLALPLRPSALRSLDRTNAAVFGLGQGLKQQISRFTVSPLNNGPQYMEAFSYLQMQNALVHYSLIGHLFDRLSTPYRLPWIMYDAYQAAHCSGVHPAGLGALAPAEFILRFGQPLVTGHTACALSSVYCTDYALNSLDVAYKLKETEDMAKTYSCLALQSQPGLEGGTAATVRSYAPPPQNGLSSDPVQQQAIHQCVLALQRAQQARRDLGLSRRMSYAALLDDCENAAQGIIGKAKGIRMLHAQHAPDAPALTPGLSAPPPQAAVDSLADAMCRVAAAPPWSRLFANLSRRDHATMAVALLRLGGMLRSGDWTTSFAVVSAKGPAYTEACPDAPGALSGHGTVISRIRTAAPASGRPQTFHGPLEGTTYLCQDPPTPEGMAEGLTVRLDDGSVAPFDNSAFATIFGQNVHRTVGISADNNVLGHLQADYGDTPQRCPFYVSVFYTGLSEGALGSLGCIPLDTKPPPSFCSGAQPVFGAPVLGLSMPSTMAVPVSAAMLADDADERSALLALLDAQMQELCPPEANQDTIAAIASYWQPVAPLRTGADLLLPAAAAGRGAPLLRRRNFAGLLRSVNTWAFDDPADAGMAVRLYGALALRFNSLQAKDPAGDGVVAAAFGHYLSAALRFDIPMRPANSPGVLAMSTFRNLRQAAADIGLGALTSCPLKMAAIDARAAVPVASDHHFYMCSRGEGPVHAHRVRLA